MPFSVAADQVVEGWWTVVGQSGSVVRRTISSAPRPAVFRTRREADACARRWNAHLEHVSLV